MLGQLELLRMQEELLKKEEELLLEAVNLGETQPVLRAAAQAQLETLSAERSNLAAQIAGLSQTLEELDKKGGLERR